MVNQSMIRGQWSDYSTEYNRHSRRQIVPADAGKPLEGDSSGTSDADAHPMSIGGDRSNEVGR